MEDEGCVVRIRGLPWSATAEEIANFLEDVNIIGGANGVNLTFMRDGRPSGEAYIELMSESDVEQAMKKNNEHMGKRYIEVFRATKSEMDWVVKRSGPNQVGANDAVVRLRGLPFGCTKEEIAHFFAGLEIVPNGISFVQDQRGRITGEAFVQFAAPDIAEEAREKHKEKIGHRYIEIFKSSMAEARAAMNPFRIKSPMGGGMNRPSPYDRMDRFGGGGGGGGGGMGGGFMGSRGRGRGNLKGFYDDDYDDFGGNQFGGFGGGMGGRRMGGGMGRSGGGRFGGMGGGYGGGGGGSSGFGGGNRGGGTPGSTYQSTTGYWVHMRGLPFQANEPDICGFFEPLNPIHIEIHFNRDGRASGEADVDFSSAEEAKEAMKKNREKMQHRYIELFLHSVGSSANGSGASAGSFGSGMTSQMSNFGSGMNSNYGAGSGTGNRFDNGGSMNYYGNSSMGGNMSGGMGTGGGYGNQGMGSTPGVMGNNYTAFS